MRGKFRLTREKVQHRLDTGWKQFIAKQDVNLGATQGQRDRKPDVEPAEPPHDVKPVKMVQPRPRRLRLDLANIAGEEAERCRLNVAVETTH